MVIGLEVVFVNVIGGIYDVPLVVVNPLIFVGIVGIVHVIFAFAVGEVMVTPLDKFCEQIVRFGIANSTIGEGTKVPHLSGLEDLVCAIVLATSSAKSVIVVLSFFTEVN